MAFDLNIKNIRLLLRIFLFIGKDLICIAVNRKKVFAENHVSRKFSRKTFREKFFVWIFENLGSRKFSPKSFFVRFIENNYRENFFREKYTIFAKINQLSFSWKKIIFFFAKDFSKSFFRKKFRENIFRLIFSKIFP